MPFLLLMLLAAIGLIITLVGYLLTPKTQPRNRRTAYRTDYYANRGGRGVREPLAARNVRYVAAYTEESTWTWADVWQSLSISRVFRRRLGEPTPWLGITLILVSVFLLGMFMLRTLMPNATLIGALSWPLSSSNSPSQSQSNSPQDGPYTASKSLVRLSQLDPGQYNSTQEYNLWAYSACSSASMTEVINAYGHHYRVTDILKVESQIGEITPELGLLEDGGIARTVTHFGFKTSWGHNLSLDNVIDTANRGEPVIVSFPPDRYDGGHLVVVIGGDSKNEIGRAHV